MEEWTQEELICAIGTISLDLRGSWGGESYPERIKECLKILNFIEGRDKDKEEFRRISHEQLEESFEYGIDGRYFRDKAFYGEIPEAGKTDRVAHYLFRYLDYPEYNWLEASSLEEYLNKKEK